MREVLALYWLFLEFGPAFKLVSPIPVIGDNQGALKMADHPIANSRTKHIDIRHHFVRYYVTVGIIKMHYVCTTDNIADFFSKPLIY